MTTSITLRLGRFFGLGRHYKGKNMANANINLGLKSLGRSANEIDRHVGARMRERRIMLGLSQIKMAALIGITYQQLCKYERAKNRMTASRLHATAVAMGVSVEYFFQDLDSYDFVNPLVQHEDLVELSQNFLNLPSHDYRQAFSVLTRALAGKRDRPLEQEDGPLELATAAVPAEVA
jgi:transcriptional regulator with XRE-family HTH domain